jgi:hypothetical protein
MPARSCARACSCLPVPQPRAGQTTHHGTSHPRRRRAHLHRHPDGRPRCRLRHRAQFTRGWGGARTGKEDTLSDRVVRYDIQATLDPVKHTIDGKQKLTWRNRSAQPVCAIYLHMYLNAFEGPAAPS